MDLQAQEMCLVSICVWCPRFKAWCHGGRFVGVKVMLLEFKKYVTTEASSARAVSAIFAFVCLRFLL